MLVLLKSAGDDAHIVPPEKIVFRYTQSARWE